ncbi:MAG TPA: cytochrome C biogenesis protein, partial [Sutterellaceae bacterium]|nr:cytochrome C biogenesis protein [Sutterellaceae bacterium]
GLFYTMAKRKKLKPVELTEEQKRRAEELLRGTEPAKRRDAK